jgi:3-oxoacyl-[acyl-carrier-protein] synthase II
MVNNYQNRRVVITGLGVVSSIGIGWEEFWKNLINGKSGISKITSFDTSAYDRHYAGEVKNFDPTKYMNARKSKTMGRASQMAIAASKQALDDAEFIVNENERERFGVSIGTTTGEIGIVEALHDIQLRNGKQKLSKSILAATPSGSLALNVATEFNLRGNNIVFGTACSSANYAVGYAFDLIKSGKLDYALAGGADGFSRIVFSGFTRLLAIAPQKCQPFDKNRQGMIPGEGASIILLETLDSALKRKAKIYAEVLGYGLSCDGHHMTVPFVDSVACAINKSLENSFVTINQVDYISAHGTGTKENDKAECAALKKVFKEELIQIPVSSIKSMIGHTMGAAAAFETIACSLAITFNQIPPTTNFEENDPECKINCVPNVSIKKNIRVALNNSQAFGGNNACLIIKNINYKL